jgi:RNA recognition motif-containing protein
MSRLIVKNIPKFVGEKELTGFFGKAGQVTDCKIAEKNGVSRRFCFIGNFCAYSPRF